MNKGFVRSKTQQEIDNVDIARLYCQGYPQHEIASILNAREDNPPGYQISQPNISVCLKKIRAEWKKSTLLDFNERLMLEVARIDQLEHMYYLAYERSLGEEISTKTTGVKTGDDDDEDSMLKMSMEQTKKRSLTGSLQALEGVRKCIELRCKLLGMLDHKVSLDIKSGGKEIKNNIIVLPENFIGKDIQGFDDKRMQEMLKVAQQAEHNSDD